MTLKGLKHGFLWTLSGRLGLMLSGLVAAALINRALTPEGRGVFAEMQTLVGLFAVLFGFSLDTAIYHFANRERFRIGDGARLALALGASICTAAFAALVLWGFVAAWPENVSGEFAALLPLLLAWLVFVVLGTNLLALGQALGKVRLAALVVLVQGVANVSLIGVAYLFAAVNLRYAILVTFCVQALGVAGIGSVLWRQNVISLEGITPSVIWQFVVSGLKQHVATISTFVYTKVNQLIVFHSCGESQAGLLAAALTLAFGIFGAFGALQLALYPRVIHFADDFEITIRSLRVSFYAGLIIVIPMVVFARPILHAYGGVLFEEAAWMFRLILPAAWFLTLSSMAAPYYVKAGAFKIAGFTAVLLGVISLALNFAMVPHYLAIGAAAATLLTMLCGFMLVLLMLKAISGTSPLRMFIPDFHLEIAEIMSICNTVMRSRRA